MNKSKTTDAQNKCTITHSQYLLLLLLFFLILMKCIHIKYQFMKRKHKMEIGLVKENQFSNDKFHNVAAFNRKKRKEKNLLEFYALCFRLHHSMKSFIYDDIDLSVLFCFCHYFHSHFLLAFNLLSYSIISFALCFCRVRTKIAFC